MTVFKMCKQRVLGKRGDCKKREKQKEREQSLYFEKNEKPQRDCQSERR